MPQCTRATTLFFFTSQDAVPKFPKPAVSSPSTFHTKLTASLGPTTRSLRRSLLVAPHWLGSETSCCNLHGGPRVEGSSTSGEVEETSCVRFACTCPALRPLRWTLCSSLLRRRAGRPVLLPGTRYGRRRSSRCACRFSAQSRKCSTRSRCHFSPVLNGQRGNELHYGKERKTMDKGRSQICNVNVQSAADSRRALRALIR